MSELFNALKAGNLREVAQLLDAGAAIEERTASGRTPLHVAAQNHKFALVQLLLDRGASVRATDYVGNTVLMDTVAKHNFTPEATALLESLLGAGSDVNAENADGWTALMRICHGDKRYNSVARLLIDNGANVNHQSKDGWTPLSLASHDRRLGGWDGPAAVLLSSGGIDVNLPGLCFGWTPLLIAAKTSSFNMCELLLQHGANRGATLQVGPGKHVPNATTLAENLYREINTTKRFHGFNAVQLATHHKRGAIAKAIETWGSTAPHQLH